jgi:hypothetical protein
MRNITVFLCVCVCANATRKKSKASKKSQGHDNSGCYRRRVAYTAGTEAGLV